MWEWIIGILLLVLAVPVAMYVIGMMQPGGYRGEATGHVNAPPETVFRDILDVERFPVFGSSTRTREDLPEQDGKRMWKENIGMSEVVATVGETEEPKRIVFDLKDAKVPMTARWTIDLEPDGEGTKVNIEQRGTIEKGAVHSAMLRFIMTYTGGANTHPRDLVRRLAAAHSGGGEA